MKLTQLILFSFITGWIAGEVACVGYSQKLVSAILLALITAYLNNVHGIIWQKLKRSRYPSS